MTQRKAPKRKAPPATESFPRREAAEDYAHNLLVGIAQGVFGEVALAPLALMERARELLCIDTVDGVADRSELVATFSRWRARRPQPRSPRPLWAPLAHNVRLITELVGLDEAEEATYRCIVAIAKDEGLRSLLKVIPAETRADALRFVAVATARPTLVVSRALHPHGRLIEAGLITVDSHRYHQNVAPAEQFEEVLDLEGLDRAGLLDLLHPAAAPTELEPPDFAHLGDAFDTCRALLAASLAARRLGVNVLFHGPPGTGKTCFASLLARSLGANLRVTGAGGHQAPGHTPAERLASLVLGQRALRDGRSLLLFDELEDVEMEAGARAWSRTSTRPSKQWVNRLLETNAVPTIWITNAVDAVDNAFLRRFAWSVAFPSLSAGQRARVLRRHLGPGAGLSDDDVYAVSRRYPVESAVVASAVANARLLSASEDVDRATLERLLAPADLLLNGAAARQTRPVGPINWTPRGARASVDLGALADRLAGWTRSDGPGLALLFHGPPGTGKSEFAQHLARRMDREVVMRRGSDLFNKYVGATEKSIAAAFREAEADDAVLVLDEVDSLLRTRARAERSWEVSFVNELLQQLEVYRGVVVCTTNAVDDLDPAAMRRFVFKVGFQYLDDERAWSLFESALLPLVTVPTDADDARRALRHVGALAAGDFAAVRRRVTALRAPVTAAELVEELAAEVRARGGVKRGIGWR